MRITLEELAKELGGTLEGNGAAEIAGVAGIREAREGDLTFVANARYAAAAAATKATVVLVPLDWDRPCSAAIIRVEKPDSAFASVCKKVALPVYRPEPGIHPSAVVGEDCVLGKNVTIGANCVLENGCSIGDNTVLSPNITIGYKARIGSDCLFHSGVRVREYVEIGDRVILQNNAVVGSDGFGYTVTEGGARSKIDQAGIVEIGDDVEIGANSCVDRARFGRTRIGNGVKIDNLVQIAHNVVIGDHAVLVAQVAIAGSTIVGDRVILAGQCGVAGHLHVGAGAIVGGKSGVTKDVPEKSFVSGFPAIPHTQDSRLQALIRKLPDMRDQIKELQERLDNLDR